MKARPSSSICSKARRASRQATSCARHNFLQPVRKPSQYCREGFLLSVADEDQSVAAGGVNDPTGGAGTSRIIKFHNSHFGILFTNTWSRRCNRFSRIFPKTDLEAAPKPSSAFFASKITLRRTRAG